MTECKYCNKDIGHFECLSTKNRVHFCDEECLKEYCEEYVNNNWREHLQSNGVNFRE